MSPRPRTVADADVLAAAARTINRVGPLNVTLADVAAAAGLSPATLVQRFGSKRGLLLALVRHGAGAVGECFAEARRTHASCLGALVAAATQMTRTMQTPEELANGLAFLQMDVSDPDFHRLALAHSRETIAGYRGLLDDAVRAGELRPCDTAALARAIGALSGGSLIAWAIHRQGTAERWVRQDIETLLGPHRTAPRPGARSRTAPRRRRA